MQNRKEGFRVLIIEDNPGDFALVEDYLSEKILEPEIVHAKSFLIASGILSRNDTPFDAILLDITLPDKSGQSLINEILQLASTQPVIILTGFADIEFSAQAIGQGASDYLLKDDLNASTLYKSIVYCLERKKNLLDLKESEQRYSDLFHLSPLPMWVYELGTLQILDVNSAAIQHYGYSFEEFLTMNVREIHIAEDRANDGGLTAPQGENNGPTHKRIVKNRKKNGEIIHVDWYNNPIDYKGKKAAVVLAHDITERFNYIKDIETKNNKLTEIAWIQSHVVRAPLARMLGLIELIKDPRISPAERDELLIPLLQSANELDNLIRDISAKTYDAESKN